MGRRRRSRLQEKGAHDARLRHLHARSHHHYFSDIMDLAVSRRLQNLQFPLPHSSTWVQAPYVETPILTSWNNAPHSSDRQDCASALDRVSVYISGVRSECFAAGSYLGEYEVGRGGFGEAG